MIKKIFLLIILSTVFIFSFGVVLVSADVGPLIDTREKTDSGKNEDKCAVSGDCELNDMIQTLIDGSQIILGLSGSFALLAFVIGGIMLLVSGGNSTWIERGKNTIFGAAIGLAIVMLSWVIIWFVFDVVLDKKWDGKALDISRKNNNISIEISQSI